MKFDLTLDIGNTWIKGAYFDKQGLLVQQFQHKTFGDDFKKAISQPNLPINAYILSNVRQIDTKSFSIKSEQKISLDYTTPLPFNNLYYTPKTLGMDRIAAIAGGNFLFPKQDILVITAGTCITYNLLNRNQDFLGGGISPGLTMRYRALSKFTGKLPLVRHQEFDNLIGMDTEESIRSGVQNGLIAEVDEIINKYKAMYSDIKIIMTGGATVFFENKLKSEIFADQNLIFRGLYQILKYNVK